MISNKTYVRFKKGMALKMRNILFIIFIAITSGIYLSCSFNSDESILRDEFNIPGSAEMVYFEVYPKESGWFGREGLKIDAYFQFSDEDFANYLSNAKKSKEWLPLPIPKDFLMHMFSVKSSKESIRKSYQETNRPLPEEGSVYNPTEEQMLKKGIEILPVTGSHGIFTLKAAGTDIMNAPKKTYTTLEKDLNDYMLGILDFDQKKLFIKVSTSY
jgi:hypothetical protein